MTRAGPDLPVCRVRARADAVLPRLLRREQYGTAPGRAGVDGADPFPVRSYRSTVRVAPITATGQAFVEWWCDYDADAQDEGELNTAFGDGVYATGIQGLMETLK